MQKGCSENVTLKVNSGTVSNFLGLIFYLTQFFKCWDSFIYLFILFIYFFLELIIRGGRAGYWDLRCCGVANYFRRCCGDLKPYGVRCF